MTKKTPARQVYLWGKSDRLRNKNPTIWWQGYRQAEYELDGSGGGLLEQYIKSLNAEQREVFESGYDFYKEAYFD